MQKTLIAAAALLGFAAAAQAQSSVTLYGLIDLNISHYSAGSKSGAANNTAMNDGTVNGLNGSRWGIRTTEDLGDGLKAAVVMESGLIADTGSLGQGGRIFGRQVFVSLASPRLGEVRLGRQYILEDSVMGMSNPFGNALTLNPGTGVTASGKALPFWLNAPRADNIAQYQTPTMGGFYAAFQITPESATTADRFYGTKLAYSVGKLNTAMSYEWNKSRITESNVNQSLTLAVNYDFGVAKLYGGLQRNRHLVTTSGNGAFTGSNLQVIGETTFTADRIDGWTVGAEAPVGLFLFGANYTVAKYASPTGSSLNLGKLAAGVRYVLSKNTFLYAAGSVSTGDLKDYIAQKTVVQTGIRTAF